MKIYHHNDMDGLSSASMVILCTHPNIKPDEYNKIVKESCIELTHNKEEDAKKLSLVEPGELVYIVDYSFTDNTKHMIDGVLEKTDKLVWIDHHISSIEFIKKYDYDEREYEDIKGLRFNGISGAALVYIYFNTCRLNECPYYIQLISDYDCWNNKLQPDTDYFKLGYDGAEDKFKILYSLYVDYKRGRGEVEDLLIRNGKCIKGYIDSENEYYRNQYGYESKTEDGVPIFCVNKDTNSWIFGDLIKKYPAVCNYAFDGKEWVYSFYSDTNSDFDCSVYCTKYGGGGHKGAAGFRSSELLYKAIK